MCRVRSSQLVAAVTHAREGGWHWRGKELEQPGAQSQSLPSPAVFPRGIVSLGPLRLRDVVLGGGCGVASPGSRRVAQGAPDGSGRAPAGRDRVRPLSLPKPPPFTSGWGKAPREPQASPLHRGQILPQTVSRAQQDGDSAGTPKPEPWWPKKGPCPVPISPCSTCHRVHHLDLHILLCLYSMYRIYSIGQLFPSRLEVSPKMTSFINKYIYIN